MQTKEQEIILTVGLPASGKSTFALALCSENANFKRVNKDDIRSMTVYGGYSKKAEDLILSISRRIGEEMLNEGYSIIIDDTNLSDKHIKFWSEKAYELGIKFTLKFFDVSVEECIKRDKERKAEVGENVINNMSKQYNIIKSKYKKAIFDERIGDYAYLDSLKISDKLCIIVDIDGTLSLTNGRSPYVYKFDDDKVNKPIANIVKQMGNIYDIMLVTGRPESVRVDTEKWLKSNGIEYDYLFMRETGDNRHDNEIKKELYEKHIKDKFKVVFVIEDRDRVVDMYRKELKLCTLQPYYGNF